MFKLLGSLMRLSTHEVHTRTSTGLIQQIRNTFILKRRYPLQLHKIGRPPRRLRNRHYVYDFVENTNSRPPKMIDVILTDFVEGVGLKGEQVKVNSFTARDTMLMSGLAVYASPENIIRYKRKVDDAKDIHSSMYATKTVRYLTHYVLTVVMNMKNSWTIEPWHIKTACRQSGIVVTEDAITLPDKPISGPNMELEGKAFVVKIKINNLEEARLRCKISHWTTDITKMVIPSAEDASKPLQPIFAEDEDLLSSMPPPQDLLNSKEFTNQK